MESTPSSDSNNDEIYIHTVTFRVRNGKLPIFLDSVRSNNDNGVDNGNGETVETERVAGDLDTAIKTDGAQINGKSARYYERTSAQHCTSTLSNLREEINGFTESNNGRPVSVGGICPIVLSHGYGCAGGIIIPSITTIFETLLSGITVDESPVIHIIDWLGNGMSSRPEFQCETTEEAEDWFVESLEAWPNAMVVAKMILSAYSLGGYASTVYAMRYVMNV